MRTRLNRSLSSIKLLAWLKCAVGITIGVAAALWRTRRRVRSPTRAEVNDEVHELLAAFEKPDPDRERELEDSVPIGRTFGRFGDRAPITAESLRDAPPWT